MKNICVVTRGLWPVPDIKGGAPERLLTILIDENEKKGKFHLTILSCADKNLKQIQYKYTKLVYIKKELCIMFYIKKIIYWLLVIYKKIYWEDLFVYSRSVERYIKKRSGEFDYVIFEDQFNYASNSRISEAIGRNRMILHVCTNKYATPEKDRIYGTVWGISDFVTREYKSTSSGVGIEFRTLRNAIDLSRFQRKAQEAQVHSIKGKYGIKPDDFVLLYIGRIIPVKGVLQLVEAVLSIPDKKIKLLILGSVLFKLKKTTKYMRQIAQLAKKHSDRILMLGFIDNDQLINYMRCADVGVVPSLWEEGFGLSYLEMMAAGLPTIATKSGGMVEIGTDQTTLFIEKDRNIRNHLSEAILQLKKDAHRRHELGRKAVERANEFSASKYYHDFCKLVGAE